MIKSKHNAIDQDESRRIIGISYLALSSKAGIDPAEKAGMML